MFKQVIRALSRLFLLPLFLLLLLSSCNCEAKVTDLPYTDSLGFTADTANINLVSYCKNNVLILKDTIDLQGKTLYLPVNLTVKVRKGIFRNGIIVGNKTRLSCRNNKAIFDSVHIKGTWIVPQINSSMFKDLAYDNSLKDVLGLANPNIDNTILIKKGEYQVTATRPSEMCLLVPSNTDIIIDGSINLTPNDYPMYSIIGTEGDNIIIRGTGCLIGDKFTHKKDAGDWGMGVYIMGGSNVTVRDLTIKQCWGDCVYINKGARDILIDRCNLKESRRQGMSITSAQNVEVRNCTISKVRGAEPGYGIDIEPNKGDTVMSVTIKNLKIFDCYGGILTYGVSQNAHIDEVNIQNCSIKDIEWCPLNFKNTNKVVVRNCDIQTPEKKWGLVCNTINNVNIERMFINEQRVKKDIKQNRLIAIDNSNNVVIH